MCSSLPWWINSSRSSTCKRLRGNWGFVLHLDFFLYYLNWITSITRCSTIAVQVILFYLSLQCVLCITLSVFLVLKCLFTHPWFYTLNTFRGGCSHHDGNILMLTFHFFGFFPKFCPRLYISIFHCTFTIFFCYFIYL